MKRVIVFVAALLICGAAASQETGIYQSKIVVTGKAEREVPPNEIYVKIVLDESDSKGKISLADQEKNMLKTLKVLKIDIEKQLQIGDMSSDLKSYFLKKNQVQTQKTYVLKLDNAAVTGAVFEALGSLGISQMEILKMTRSDLETIKMEMRTEAMKNARQIAETLAGAIGQKAGPAFEITDYDNFYNAAAKVRNASIAYDGLAEMTVAGSSMPVLDFQNMKLSYTVNVKFLLQ